MICISLFQTELHSTFNYNGTPQNIVYMNDDRNKSSDDPTFFNGNIESFYKSQYGESSTNYVDDECENISLSRKNLVDFSAVSSSRSHKFTHMSEENNFLKPLPSAEISNRTFLDVSTSSDEIEKNEQSTSAFLDLNSTVASKSKDSKKTFINKSRNNETFLRKKDTGCAILLKNIQKNLDKVNQEKMLSRLISPRSSASDLEESLNVKQGNSAYLPSAVSYYVCLTL